MPVNILSVVVFYRLSASVQAQGITVVIVIMASLVMAISVWDLLLRYRIYNFCITLRFRVFIILWSQLIKSIVMGIQ